MPIVSGFFGVVLAALLVGTAFEVNPKLGGGLLLLIVFTMLVAANRAGTFPAH